MRITHERMQRLWSAVAMQAYALLLVWVQMHNGVRTDEAKYLLNIPYPHPPFARFILGMNDGWTHQELFWRIVCASLVVQAVWLITPLLRSLSVYKRVAVFFMWLASAAVVLQAGTVMMAPLTALQGWCFVVLLLQQEHSRTRAGFVGLLWLMTLFTAYQGILFAPLVWVLLHDGRRPTMRTLSAFFVPITLLVLYTFSNPLVLASMSIQSAKDAADTLTQRLIGSVRLWLLGGSIVMSVIGLWGMVRSRMWSLCLTCLLLFAYVFLARFDYYAILFTPVLFGGSVLFLLKRQTFVWHSAVVTVIGTCVMLWFAPLITQPSPARSVMQGLSLLHATGSVLMSGPFGHEWQYEAGRMTVSRWAPSLEGSASAVVCTADCPAIDASQTWKRLGTSTPAIYIPR